MYTIVRKDCLCLAAGFLQIYVDVYVQSLLYLTVRKVCIHKVCMYIYPMGWRSISSYPMSIVQHTHRDSRGPSVSGCFFLLTVFFSTLTMAPCRSRRSFLTTRLCTYRHMYTYVGVHICTRCVSVL